MQLFGAVFFVIVSTLSVFSASVSAFSVSSGSFGLGRLHSSKFLNQGRGELQNRCHVPSRRNAQPAQWAALVDVTDATFKEAVIESEVPTLVSFWASWCGPCRMIKPVLEDLETEFEGRMNVAQINTDDNQGTATEYGIRSIPTLILFKDGERLDTIIGAVPKSTLEAKLSSRV
mmetsp:Transcript_52762/g.107645  ORF Transcript_52762/g.107645 Transcript_52762/m.107645 type:complete len:174 (-) Transcript_52762:191-712(-)|eukprot:CAMPEP_0181289458 /NCGR_PEP_ID=MMETSP1101-20121128/891_1 /TAXON_ID=46948 /ORGANISM="Rhodomonas abbreviata, Strain Caron Lab Isolate" /LENGTH=173 /DNA_ID=CAMNT_0023393677 /DNA_START=176 /DNA_END=697 /DNA_ORIENTATION=-